MKGQTYFKNFINECLLPASKMSVCDPMKKVVKHFSNCLTKTKVPIGDKGINLPEERDSL